MQQDQNIRGFTLLELLVVIAIIGILSGIAYPNFSSWNKERNVAQATERIANILKSLTTHAQRGSFPFIQFYVCQGSGCDDPTREGMVQFYGRGLYKERYVSLKNSGTALQCSLDSAYWEEPNGNNLISFFGTDDIGIQFIASDSGVCFSGDGSNYQLLGEIPDSNEDIKVTATRDITNYVLICHVNDTAVDGTCPVSFDDGLEQPAYLIEWSRFGNIIKYRYTVRQNEGFWTQK